MSNDEIRMAREDEVIFHSSSQAHSGAPVIDVWVDKDGKPVRPFVPFDTPAKERDDESTMTVPLRAALRAYRSMSKKLLCPICEERGCEHTTLEKLLADTRRVR